VIELPVPPKAQREQILQSYCADLLSRAQIARMAEVPTLAPAVVARASAVVRTISQELGAEKSTSALELLISSTLEAQGHAPLAQNNPDRLPEIYAPRFIHANADLTAIAQGLTTTGTGRLCLYGPPGTGKTAYARWIAEQLGAPLLVKRASDLMSMWVGENEKNIASAFKQAKEDGAVLLIDEVDSFLQDRRNAQRSWEVSLVNEMLTQMESYSGVFIASTNLMNNLDQAALRRFDLKVKFDFLRLEQAWDLLCSYCTQIALNPPTNDLQARLTRLKNLTPGDFAAVMRQHRFRPIKSPAILIEALESECAIKEGAKQTMGFV